MKTIINIFFLLMANLTVLESALAFQLSPIVAELSPVGDGSSFSFTLENRKKEKVAAKTEVFLREYDADGKEIKKPTQDFLVYPMQLALEPGEKRNIRLTWVGDKNISKEMAYRFVVQQLPLEFNKAKDLGNGGSVKFLINFVASVFVKPAGAYAQAKIDRTERIDSQHAKIFLKNHGTAHQVLSEMKIVLSMAEEKKNEKPRSWTFSKDNVKDLEIGSLMPGQEKTLTLNLSKEVPPGVLKGEIVLP